MSATSFRPKTSRGQSAKVTVNPSEVLDVTRSRSAHPLTERFEVEELLGEGGMGRVFVAHDRGLGRAVAIKQLHEGLEHDADALRRFVLEAQIGAQLTHPNILPLYSFEHADSGAPAFAMQLVDGRPLADYAKEASEAPPAERRPGGRFALKERLAILLGACDATHFAHQRGVIHRDLKPENVMLGRHREVYLMDWGLARVLEQDGSASASAPEIAPAPGVGDAPVAPERLGSTKTASSPPANAQTATQQGQVMGTPQYMAPEQAQGDIAKLGPATDEFALGVMLAELATLHPARSWTSLGSALVEASLGEVAVGNDIDGFPLDPALSAIIARATAKAPEDRYSSVDTMAEDIRRFIRDEPVSVYAEPVAKRALRAAGRRPALSVGVTAGVLLLLALVAITNLLRAERAAARHAREIEGTKRLLVAVGDRSHAVDVWFSDVAGGLGRLGAAAEELLDRPSEGDASVLPPAPQLTFSARHDAEVGFERPHLHWNGKAAGEPPSRPVLRLLALTPWLREALAEGLPPQELDAGADARQASVTAGHSALLRSFVGVETDGSFVQYPARIPPAGYDPRKRPWYRAATAYHTQAWSRPMLSLGGNTLRVSALLPMRSKGVLKGVAGVDLRVSEIAARLDLDVPGFRRAYLVLPDGRIAVSKDLEARFVRAGLEADQDLVLPLVDEPRLVERLATMDSGGFFRSGDKLVAYARMVSPAWTYVAEVDAAPYLGN